MIQGFEIERYGSRYRFLSKAFVCMRQQRNCLTDKISKLSNAALETSAIIAFKQPTTRVEIEEIRGVSADVMIRKLEARGLIKEEGRSDAPGRPFLYPVIRLNLDAFKLLSLDELPDLPEFNKDNTMICFPIHEAMYETEIFVVYILFLHNAYELPFFLI